jgi:MATE family multidrug resistance protein
MSLIANLRREFRPMLRLAVPLAMAELGWMAMGFVDIVMAGPLGPVAIGAGSLGNMLFFPLVICGTGMLLGMDTLAARAFGARDLRECRRILINGLWMALGLTPLLATALWLTIPLLRSTGTNPRVMALVVPYLKALLWGIFPLVCYSALRRYLQAMNIVKPLTFAVISANLINLAGDWALMYGHLGAPAMGLTGSAWSTSIARVYIAVVLAGAVLWEERKAGNPIFLMSWKPELARIRDLCRLGLPVAMQILIEGGVFGVVTVLAARLDEASLAAHSLAVNVVSITYMVPLGISSAAAVRVGQAFGRRDGHGIAIAGWTALLLSGIFMGGAGLALALLPRWIIWIYTRDAAVIGVGAGLLRIAALFQLFDGFQVVAGGALRGLGDTRSPMLAHLAGYWVIGMPVVYVSCFSFGWGAQGIWAGLCLALILIGIALVWVWRWRLRQNAYGMLA